MTHQVAEIFSRGWYGEGWGNDGPSFWAPSFGTGLPEKFHMNKTVIKTTVYDPQLVFIVPKGTQSLAEDFAQVSSRVIGAEFNDVKLYSVPKNEPIPPFLNKFQRLGVRSYKWLEADNEDTARGIALPPMPADVRAELISKRLLSYDETQPLPILKRMPKLF